MGMPLNKSRAPQLAPTFIIIRHWAHYVIIYANFLVLYTIKFAGLNFAILKAKDYCTFHIYEIVIHIIFILLNIKFNLYLFVNT